MVELRALQADEFAGYCTYFVPDYALDLAANHGLSDAAAMTKARDDLACAFPDGPDAPGQNLLAITRGSDLIGYLWYEAQADGVVAFVQDFHILPRFQGLGLAKAAMAALEIRVRGEGVAQIKLRVAANNPVARHVYDAGGFRVSGVNMYKPVG